MLIWKENQIGDFEAEECKDGYCFDCRIRNEELSIIVFRGNWVKDKYHHAGSDEYLKRVARKYINKNLQYDTLYG